MIDVQWMENHHKLKSAYIYIYKIKNKRKFIFKVFGEQFYIEKSDYITAKLLMGKQQSKTNNKLKENIYNIWHTKGQSP